MRLCVCLRGRQPPDGPAPHFLATSIKQIAEDRDSRETDPGLCDALIHFVERILRSLHARQHNLHETHSPPLV